MGLTRLFLLGTDTSVPLPGDTSCLVTDGQQNLGGINLSLVAKGMRMHQVCWGESKISVVKPTVLCEVFSSRISKKAGNQKFKNTQGLSLLPTKVWACLPTAFSSQPLGGFIKHNTVPTSSSSWHLCLLRRSPGCCWVAFPAVPG